HVWRGTHHRQHRQGHRGMAGSHSGGNAAGRAGCCKTLPRRTTLRCRLPAAAGGKLMRVVNHASTIMSARIHQLLAVFLLAIAFVTLPPIMAARAAVDIQEVKSDSGVTAWLVEDYTVPIITVRFAFKGGTTQDPAGKEGIANLMTGLFDEGAGDLDSDTFQEKLDEVGAEMSFSATRDAIY